MLIPDPADLIRAIVLILRKPKFALLANHIKDLSTLAMTPKEYLHSKIYVPRLLRKSDKDIQPRAAPDRC